MNDTTSIWLFIIPFAVAAVIPSPAQGALSAGSGGLLMRRIFCLPAALPFPRQQFMETRGREICDVGKDMVQHGLGPIQPRLNHEEHWRKRTHSAWFGGRHKPQR